MYEYCLNDPINRYDFSGLQDTYIIGELDLVGITGMEFGVGFVFDWDSPGESGVFFSYGFAAGGSVGVGIGGGYAPNDVEGTATTFDINTTFGVSSTVSSDKSGFNGVAVTVGPGGGASGAVTTTTTVSVNDFLNWLDKAYKETMLALYKLATPCPWR